MTKPFQASPNTEAQTIPKVVFLPVPSYLVASNQKSPGRAAPALCPWAVEIMSPLEAAEASHAAGGELGAHRLLVSPLGRRTARRFDCSAFASASKTRVLQKGESLEVEISLWVLLDEQCLITSMKALKMCVFQLISAPSCCEDHFMLYISTRGKKNYLRVRLFRWI